MHCEKIFLYENRQDVTLTTYILDKSPELIQKPKGAVLICPGGGYFGCSDREGEPVALAFAAMGYHAFVLRYSTYNEGALGKPIDFENFQPKSHCLFPKPTYDIGKAMIYIKSRAAEWQIDPDKIAVCGFSAGGHNCAMYSVYWNKPLLTDFFNVSAEVLRPAASILCYPVTDFYNKKANNDTYKGMRKVYFGTENPDEEISYAATPHLHVDGETPPTFIWSTSDDAVVPINQSLSMAKALSENAVPYELHIFEKGVHGLSLGTQASSAVPFLISGDIEKWIRLCEAWLRKRFDVNLE